MTDRTLSYNGYVGSIEVSMEDRCLHGRILFINDLITYEGETIAQLEEEFKGAVDRYLDYCVHTGRDADKPCSGTFQVRIGPNRHRAIVRKAATKGQNINEAICAAVDQWLMEGNPLGAIAGMATGTGQVIYGTVRVTTEAQSHVQQTLLSTARNAHFAPPYVSCSWDASVSSSGVGSESAVTDAENLETTPHVSH